MALPELKVSRRDILVGIPSVAAGTVLGYALNRFFPRSNETVPSRKIQIQDFVTAARSFLNPGYLQNGLEMSLELYTSKPTEGNFVSTRLYLGREMFNVFNSYSLDGRLVSTQLFPGMGGGPSRVALDEVPGGNPIQSDYGELTYEDMEVLLRTVYVLPEMSWKRTVEYTIPYMRDKIEAIATLKGQGTDNQGRKYEATADKFVGVDLKVEYPK